MKKARNRSDLKTGDFRLPRSKILRGKRNFERLFQKSTVLSNQSIQFRYRIYQDPAEGCLVGFIAPKKRIRGAVKRNRIKRVLREAYRCNQDYFSDLFSQKYFGVHAVFMTNSDELSYDQAEKEMVPILKKARGRFLEFKKKKTGFSSESSFNESE